MPVFYTLTRPDLYEHNGKDCFVQYKDDTAPDGLIPVRVHVREQFTVLHLSWCDVRLSVHSYGAVHSSLKEKGLRL